MAKAATAHTIRITRPTALRKTGQVVKAAAPVITGAASALGYHLLSAAPNSTSLAILAGAGLAVGAVGSLITHLGLRMHEHKVAITELTANGHALRSRGAKQQALITSHEKEKLELLKKARKKERTALINVIEGFRSRTEKLVEDCNKAIDYANYFLPDGKKIEWRAVANPNEKMVAYTIGEGGMGRADRLYAPLLQRFSTRKVVKLPPGLSPEYTENLRNRAREEALILTKIRHPNIVEAYDADIDTETNMPYIDMEYLEGESAGEYLARKGGKLMLEPAAWILYAVMRGLKYVHGEGIIHRDIKPDNIFILAEGELHELDRVKIIDFGIAKGKGFRPAETQFGRIAGATVFYSPPEQLQGKEDIDWKADIYAAGATFYELVTGRPPILLEGKTASEELPPEDFGKLVAAIISEEPPPMGRFAENIPRDVENLIASMLEKDPKKRPGYDEIFKVMGNVLEPVK